jgi:hypothetical protein
MAASCCWRRPSGRWGSAGGLQLAFPIRVTTARCVQRRARAEELRVSANESRRHHYVPQFYLRRFACPDDANKVMMLERHRDVVVADRKSIDRIGYEDGLHDYDAGKGPASIEGALNKVIETPFSKSATWLKIANANCASLDETDRLPLYGFARHLQLRNLETLRFIEDQHSRFLAGELE